MHGESSFPLDVNLDWLRDKLGVVIRVALRITHLRYYVEMACVNPATYVHVFLPEYSPYSGFFYPECRPYTCLLPECSPYTVLSHRDASPGHHTAGQQQPCGYLHERSEITPKENF